MNGSSDVTKIGVGVQGGKVRVDFHDENGSWLAIDPFAAAYLGVKLMQAAYDLESSLPVPPRHHFVFNDQVLS